MYADVLIAAASAGVLAYSGRLLVPTARLRPEDIVAQAPSDMNNRGLQPPSTFPTEHVRTSIEAVIDSKIGLGLLVLGTFGAAIATIIDALAPRQQPSLAIGIAISVVAGALGWTIAPPAIRKLWRGCQHPHDMTHCFLFWLEREVGDPQAKGCEFHRAVVHTARTSQFPPLAQLIQRLETDDTNTAVAFWIVGLASRYRYTWRRPDFRRWTAGIRLHNQLARWQKRTNLGKVVPAFTAFSLPSGTVLVYDDIPAASWVRRDKWDRLTLEQRDGIVPLCPDAVFMVSSEGGDVDDLRSKMGSCLSDGAQLVALINPDGRIVEVYRPGLEPEVFTNPATVALDPELSGFALELAPIFEA